MKKAIGTLKNRRKANPRTRKIDCGPQIDSRIVEKPYISQDESGLKIPTAKIAAAITVFRANGTLQAP